MKSNYKMKYIQLPLSVFASQYPDRYVRLVERRLLPPDALFDERYIVRIQGSQFEVGYATDDWFIE